MNMKPYPRYGQMVKGYKYAKPITFKPEGWLVSGQFPADCIESCSTSGSNDDAVEFWVSKLDFSPPRDLMERYLGEYGAWDDLQTASDETLAQRVLWTAMHDIREQGSWDGLVH